MTLPIFCLILAGASLFVWALLRHQIVERDIGAQAGKELKLNQGFAKRSDVSWWRLWCVAFMHRVTSAIERHLAQRLLLGAVRNRRPRLAAGDRVLFVCEGNICRSPFAARYAQRRLHGLGEIESSGMSRNVGRRVPRQGIEAARRHGVELEEHRSRTLYREMVKRFDAIYVMDSRDLWSMYEAFPDALQKVYLIGSPGEIPDPYGGSRGQFDIVYERIATAIDSLALSA